MSKIVGAFIGCKCLEKLADEFAERIDGARSAFAQGLLQLGERLLDWIEIWRVSREQSHGCAGRLDRRCHPIDLVGAQVVHEDDFTLLESGRKDLLDIGEESRTIHRAVDDKGGGDAIAAQRGYKGQSFPMAVRNFCNQTIATRTAPVSPYHLGRDCRLVNEDKSRRIKRRLLGFQLRARGGDVRTILLGGVQSFF
jgi:hypothetical protein